MNNNSENDRQTIKRIVITDPISDRYSSLRLIDWWDQTKLSRAQVMVVGCGALGNEVLKNLALVGIGKIFLIDFDIIDASNLTRSVLFRMTDIGKRKVQVAAERVKELNPDVQVVAYDADINHQVGLGIFRRMDVVISCLDGREARLAVNRNCSKVGIPWIDGGLMAASGQLRIFIPGEGPCYECTLTEKDYDLINQRYSCQGLQREGWLQGRVPTGTAIAAIIGAMQAQEAIKIIHGMPMISGEGIIYNSMTRQLYPIKYQRRGDCMGHELYEPIIAIPEQVAQLTAGQLLVIADGQLGEGTVLELDRDLVIKLTCLACNYEIPKIKNYHDLTTSELNCPKCNNPMLPERTHQINRNNSLKEMSLAELGIPPLHILGARNGTERRYFELSADEATVFNYQ